MRSRRPGSRAGSAPLVASITAPSRFEVSRTKEAHTPGSIPASFSYTACTFAGISSTRSWYAAWTFGRPPQTTLLIRSTIVENVSSRVYCASAVLSNSPSTACRFSACCIIARTITVTALRSTNRSSTSPRTACPPIALLPAPLFLGAGSKCYETARRAKLLANVTLKGLANEA
jgi:hypothetical protein